MSRRSREKREKPRWRSASFSPSTPHYVRDTEIRGARKRRERRRKRS
jgi:hypothetical protein